MSAAKQFTLRFYYQTLTGILGEPRKFFSEYPREVEWKQPLCFLIISSLFFTGASLVCNAHQNIFIMGAILFINAVGMVVITASLGFMVMVLTVGKRASFTKFFSLYAFSTGVTLLVSWIPLFSLFAEPWKWWLVATGMTKGLGFRWTQALLIIGFSIGILILFFWTALSLPLSGGR